LNGNILGATGIVEKDLGEINKALDNFKASLMCYEKIEDVDGQINQLNNIGIVYKYKKKYGLAMDTYSKALRICNENEDKRNKGKILGNIGFIYKILGVIPRAYAAFNEALDISKEIGDLRSECINYHHLADCLLCMNNTTFTEDYLEKSLKIAKKLNFHIGIVNVYNTYGLLNLKGRNDLVKAKGSFEQAYELSDQIGYVHGKDYSSI
jgi:tetratricopeptide (TPR) repeat protein